MLSIRPSFSEFSSLLRKGNLVPVSCEILADQDTPVSAYLKLNPGTHGFLLESVEGGERWARFSFLGTGAASVFRCRGRRIEVVEKGGKWRHEEVEDPFFAFRDFMRRYRPVPSADMPRFYGGAVGYLGYDTVRFFERLPERAEQVLDVWDIYMVIPECLLIFDNISHTIRVVSCCYLPDHANPKDAYQATVERIEKTVQRLRAPLRPEGAAKDGRETACEGEHEEKRVPGSREEDEGLCQKRGHHPGGHFSETGGPGGCRSILALPGAATREPIPLYVLPAVPSLRVGGILTGSAGAGRRDFGGSSPHRGYPSPGKDPSGG